MPLLDELSIWYCVHCKAENDHTNWKCWSCGKKKNKPSTVKKILQKRKREEEARKAKEHKETISKIDNLVPPSEQREKQFDTDKINTDKTTQTGSKDIP